MKKETLKSVGIRTDTDIPAEELFSPSLDSIKFRLSPGDLKTIERLSLFVKEYNEEYCENSRLHIENSDQAALMLRPIFQGMTNEELWAIFMDGQKNVLKCEKISTGSISSSVFDTRTIVELSLKYKARLVIIAHNHPCGDVTPSEEDIKNTLKCRDVLKMLNIALVDHIILTKDSYMLLSGKNTRHWKESASHE